MNSISRIRRVLQLLREKGKVCDLGCGPGHISRFIKDQGIDVCGIDLSDGLIFLLFHVGHSCVVVKIGFGDLNLGGNYE